MITIKDWMSTPVITIKPGVSVYEAAVIMDRHNIGSIIISTDGKKPEGIITERDLLRKIVAQDKDAKQVKVEEIMTKKVITVESDTSLLEISKMMTKNVFRRIIVMENNEMIGIATSRDLLQLMSG